MFYVLTYGFTSPSFGEIMRRTPVDQFPMSVCSRVVCVCRSLQLERESVFVERSHRQRLLVVYGRVRRQEERSPPAAVRAPPHVFGRRRPYDVPGLRRPGSRDREPFSISPFLAFQARSSLANSLLLVFSNWTFTPAPKPSSSSSTPSSRPRSSG